MRVGSILGAVFAVAGFGYLAAFLTIALLRLAYPFELEWMEGAMVDQVCRLLDGEPMFCEPTAEYVPFLYAPLFFWLSAGMAQITGEGFLAGRLISLLSTCVTLALVFRFVRLRGGDRLAAWLSAGLYAGGYFVVNSWYDTGRIDSLCMMLSMLGLLLLDSGKTWRTALAAGLVMVVAYLAKQSALAMVPPFAVAALCVSPQRAAVFAGSFAGAWLVTTLSLDAATDGWFGFYTWTLARTHGYISEPLWAFWWLDLRPLWPAMALAAWLMVERLRGGEARLACRDGAWALGLTLVGLTARSHVGGGINALMPAILALALLTGLAMTGAERRSPRFRHVAPFLILLQFLAMAIDWGALHDEHPPRLQDPSRFLPSEQDREANERLVTLLREADGEVILPLHGYLPRLAGKPPTAHYVAVADVYRGGDPVHSARIVELFHATARDRDAALVILDEDRSFVEGGEPFCSPMVSTGYRFDGRLFPESDSTTLRPLLGYPTRPLLLFRRP